MEIAREKAVHAGVAVRFDLGDATALPYPDDSFDRVVSSLLFHHLSPAAKRTAAQEVFRVLRTGGSFHIADWGRPHNLLMRLAFLGVQLLDGFATTAENAAGRLPDIFIQAGFRPVEERGRFTTVFGTLALYSARKAPSDASPTTGGRTEGADV